MLGHSPVTNSMLLDGSIGAVGLIALAIGAQAHCALMCGPIASTVKRPALYTLGRVLSYGIVGAIVGWLGAIARPEPWLSITFAIVASTVVITSVLKIRLIRGPAWLTQASSRIMAALYRIGPFALGFGTPLLPCGQLWSVMGFAALSGSPWNAAAIGSGFALASTPGILSFGLVRGFVERSISKKQRWIQTAATAVLIIFMCTASAQFVWTSYRLQHEDPKSQTDLICR